MQTRTQKEGTAMDVARQYPGWTGALCALFALLLASLPPTWAQRSVGEVIDDSLITAKVKASFAADPQVSALAIDVDTANGIVSLTGVVGSEQERQRAIQLARGIEGVKQVEAHNLHLRR
jgi:osmotically-inducible protein OsmY